MRNVKKEKQLRDLDTQRIAEAAMAVIDELGADGFTMRAVAKELNVTPMALYHHVHDKAGLAGLLVDQAMREIPLPSTSGNWREDMWAMAQWMRQVTFAHPAISALRREFQLWTPAVLQTTERWLSLWQQTGLDLENSMRAARSSSTAITGFVMEELTLRHIPLPKDSDLFMLPNMRVMFDRQSNQDGEFELAVRALIDGIYARLTAQQL